MILPFSNADPRSFSLLSPTYHPALQCSTSSFYGPICACAGVAPTHFATCTAPFSNPEQINLQIASSTVVVVSFVTFEETNGLPSSPPAVQLYSLHNGSSVTITGISHHYATSHAMHSQFCDQSSPDSIARCLQRNYTMSFVKLTGLVPREQYEYKVKSGKENAKWSERFTFRALYDSGTTRIAGEFVAVAHSFQGRKPHSHTPVAVALRYTLLLALFSSPAHPTTQHTTRTTRHTHTPPSCPGSLW